MNRASGRFYLVVLVPAAVLMALEITSSRMLAPHFGNSVFVWGSIISVFLAAMSLGYAWGGRLADRSPELSGLGRLLLGAAVAQLAVVLVGGGVTERLGEWTEGAALGTLLTSLVLFGPATVLLATVAPYAVRLAARELELVGATAGRLYALSTVASLVGTLGATFVLIPSLTLEAILRLLTAATAVVACVALSAAARRERVGLVVASLVLVVAALGPAVQGVAGLASAGGEDARLVVERSTAYQTLRVMESRGVRVLTSDGIVHAAVDLETGEPRTNYARWAAAVLLLEPDPRSLLVLGLGGGSVGSYLQRRLPQLVVDYVEIDGAVSEVARRHLGFVEGPSSRVHIDDGRRFLRRNPEQVWDVIYADTYIGASVPFHLSTVEFFEECLSHLSPGGVLAINVAGDRNNPFSRALLRTLREVFTRVYVIPVPEYNHLFLASQSGDSLERLRARAEQVDTKPPFAPSLAEIARQVELLDASLADATLLSDRYAPVESLIRFDRERHHWRRLFDEPSP